MWGLKGSLEYVWSVFWYIVVVRALITIIIQCCFINKEQWHLNENNEYLNVMWYMFYLLKPIFWTIVMN